MYPTLTIDIQKIEENTKEVTSRLARHHIGVTAVTKCCAGNPDVARAFVNGGAKALGDSRIRNLKDLKDFEIPKWLIRIPMISEAEQAIEYSDLALCSELKVIEALNHEARRHHKQFDIILMGDHGDLREGWFDPDDFKQAVDSIRKLDYIRVRGLGTNSNCAGAIIPEPETFTKLQEMYAYLRDCFPKSCSIFSGGNSGAYYMAEEGTIPPVINNLRLGELLLFGAETSYNIHYPYLNENIFKVNAEIIEIKDKPSKPIGKSGKDALGNYPVFEDLGIRKRALLALGKQDVPIDQIIPEDNALKIVTASSDHLILDITDSKKEYNIGDVIGFYCNYASALFANTSCYIDTVSI